MLQPPPCRRRAAIIARHLPAAEPALVDQRPPMHEDGATPHRSASPIGRCADVTHAENILNYLWSIAPDGATNGELARALGIASQQTVYMTTQDLQRRGLLRAEQRGRIWV